MPLDTNKFREIINNREDPNKEVDSLFDGLLQDFKENIETSQYSEELQHLLEKLFTHFEKIPYTITLYISYSPDSRYWVVLNLYFDETRVLDSNLGEFGITVENTENFSNFANKAEQTLLDVFFVFDNYIEKNEGLKLSHNGIQIDSGTALLWKKLSISGEIFLEN